MITKQDLQNKVEIQRLLDMLYRIKQYEEGVDLRIKILEAHKQNSKYIYFVDGQGLMPENMYIEELGMTIKEYADYINTINECCHEI